MQEIKEDNLEILKKYTTHNERVAEVEYHPFVDLNDYKERVINDINKGNVDGFSKNEIIKEKEKVLDVLKKNTKVEPVLTEVEKDLVEIIEVKEEKQDIILEDNVILEDFNKNEEELEAKKHKDKVIYSVYEYLFESFYDFGLCFSEMKDVMPRLKEINTIEANEKPKEVNVEIFLKRYRAVGLLQKINLIAYYLGKYNYNLFAENISEKILNEKKGEDFGVELLNKYKGTEFDFYYLENFSKIVEGDRSGEYIFEENKKSDTIEESDEDTKDNKKGFLKLKPFKL